MDFREFKYKILEFRQFSQNELDFIERAFYFGKKVHNGQKRKNGEDYFNHCIRTAINLAQLKLDQIFIVSGLLHDVIEDAKVKEEEIEQNFGKEVTFIVKGVTKIGHYKYYYEEDVIQAENLRNFILAISEDIRVAIVKLADRLDNMRTLQYLPPEKQKKIALETKDIYAPLAVRLGIYEWAGELDDLSFKFLNPEKYEEIIKFYEPYITKNEPYLINIIENIKNDLEERGIKVHKIDYRIKRPSSIYKKLVKKNFDYQKIYDLFGIRIIVEKVEECYVVLGVIHSKFPYLKSEFDDYIANPKPNGYQSLHTVVLTPYNFYVEFQIRTLEMHEYAEYGTAAYFVYSESKSTNLYRKNISILAGEEDVKLIEELRKWREVRDLNEFIERIKNEFFKERIYVFTPKGKLIELPYGSTPIDFAYKVHSEIGNHCERAKVNGKIVPLNYELQNGDIVEIITNKNKKPSIDWLSFVKTSNAKKKIKAFLRKEKLKLLPKMIVSLVILAKDKIGLLDEILKCFKFKKINIIFHKGKVENKIAILKFKFEVKNKKELDEFIKYLKENVKEILEIKS